MAERRKPVDLNDICAVKIEGIGLRIDSIDTTLARVAESLTMLVRLEEKHIAHVKDDDAVAIVVKADTDRLTKLELQVGPLIEMRKWIIAGAVGVISLVAVGVFNAYNTFMGTYELQKHTVQATSAAKALPEAAAIIEESKK